MDPYLKKLRDAPLADPANIYLPQGKRVMKRGPRDKYHSDDMPPKLTRAQLDERKQADLGAKLNSLLDYYAGTDLPPERVAEHLGIYRNEQDGTDDKGKPKFKRVLDVERVKAQLDWRRSKAA